LAETGFSAPFSFRPQAAISNRHDSFPRAIPGTIVNNNFGGLIGLGALDDFLGTVMLRHGKKNHHH
jgi:hypothetical protein